MTDLERLRAVLEAEARRLDSEGQHAARLMLEWAAALCADPFELAHEYSQIRTGGEPTKSKRRPYVGDDRWWT